MCVCVSTGEKKAKEEQAKKLQAKKSKMKVCAAASSPALTLLLYLDASLDCLLVESAS